MGGKNPHRIPLTPGPPPEGIWVKHNSAKAESTDQNRKTCTLSPKHRLPVILQIPQLLLIELSYVLPEVKTPFLHEVLDFGRCANDQIVIDGNPAIIE